MSAIRISNKLVQYESTLLYTVPAGKFASLSVSFVKPAKTTLFVQTSTLPATALASNIAYTAYHPNMGVSTALGNNVNYKFKASATAWVDSSVAGTNIGFRYTIGSQDPSSTFTELKHTSYTTKSIPTLDYQADPLKTNGIYYHDGSTYRFARHTSLISTYGGLPYTSTGYSGSGSYYTCGGAIYGNSAISVDTNGASSYWYNNLFTYSAGQAVSANYTSEPSTNSCYDIASGSGKSILPGSMQVKIDDGTPYFWCSSWSAGSTPLMARILVSSVDGGSYSSWATRPTTFTGSVSGEKLFWCRKSNGYYYVGSSTNSIYISASNSFSATYAKIAAPNADVDTATPPIRISSTQLIFRSIAGTGHWVMTGGAVPTWSNVTSLPTIYAYTPSANTTVEALVTASGMTPIYQKSLGVRPLDVRIYDAGNYRDVTVGFDTRETNSDLVSKLNRNAERTNLVLNAGDKLYAYSEGTNTVVHVYGFEDQ
jgi:hypothetical protein